MDAARRTRGWLCVLTLLWLGLAAMPSVAAAEPALLELEAMVALGQVSGRIDHLAVDLGRRRVFVAELGNNTVGIVDLDSRKLTRRIDALSEPQGVGYEPSTDTLYVANAGDGSVRLFRGAELAPAGRIDLGEDADNIRVDPSDGKVYVGFGNGAIAVIDPASHAKLAEFRLDAHPEGFQLESSGSRVIANVPGARQIAVIDRRAGEVVTRWEPKGAVANYPMAIDAEAGLVLAVFRVPARLQVFAMGDGKLESSTESCSDADDVFVDAKRGRAYVSCGEGFIDIFERQGRQYIRTARIPTARGARTSLFVSALDRLFLAVRASATQPAALWVYRPAP